MPKNEPKPEAGAPASAERQDRTITSHWSVSLTVVVLIVGMVVSNLTWLFNIQGRSAVLDTKLTNLTTAFEKQSEKTDSKLDALATEMTWLKVELATIKAAQSK